MYDVNSRSLISYIDSGLMTILQAASRYEGFIDKTRDFAACLLDSLGGGKESKDGKSILIGPAYLDRIAASYAGLSSCFEDPVFKSKEGSSLDDFVYDIRKWVEGTKKEVALRVPKEEYPDFLSNVMSVADSYDVPSEILEELAPYSAAKQK